MDSLTLSLRQPTVLATFASIGIHLLAFSGLQVLTRETIDLQGPTSVDVVELTPGQIDRLPDFVQQDLQNASSTSVFSPLSGVDPTVPNSTGAPLNNAQLPAANPQDPNQFYSQNFNSPYLDTFIGSLPPPPPNTNWFDGSTPPILTNPIPLGDPNLAPPPQVSTTLPLPPNNAPTTPTVSQDPPPRPSTTATPRANNASPDASAPPTNSILDPETTAAVPPQTPTSTATPAPPPADPPLVSAVSEIQELQAQYRERYTYDATNTGLGEITARLGNVLQEMRTAVQQLDLVPEPPIQDTLPFPDPLCPANTGYTSILALVAPDGSLIRADVVGSTGYAFLDNRAKASVQRRNFPPQSQGQYRIYQYQIGFQDLDQLCRVNSTARDTGSRSESAG